MKRYLFYILLGWWAFSSCFDDKGNYDYREINELSIAGIGRDTTYTLMAFADVLRLQPEIASTLEKDESEYEYEWKLQIRLKLKLSFVQAIWWNKMTIMY